MSGGCGGSLARENLALEAFGGTAALEGLGGEPLAGENMALETAATEALELEDLLWKKRKRLWQRMGTAWQ